MPDQPHLPERLHLHQTTADAGHALEEAPVIAAPQEASALRAEVHLRAAQRALELDEADTAVRSALEAADCFAAAQLFERQCQAKLIALRVFMNTNDVSAFEALVGPLIEEALGCSAWEVVAHAHNLQGGMQLRHGKLDEAIASLERASTLRRELNDAPGYAGSLNNLGLLHQRAGNAGQALEYFLACLAFIHSSGQSLERQLGACLINVGALYRSMQLFDQADRYLQEGIETVQRNRDQRMELAGRVALADVARDRRDLKGGIAGYLKALVLAEQIGAREEEAEVLDSLGRVYAALGDDELAAQMSRKALAIASELQLVLVRVWATLSLAQLALRSGSAQEAYDLYEEAGQHAATAGLKSEGLQATEGQARASGQLGHHQRSAALFEELLQAERADHAEHEAARIGEHQARFDVEKANMEANTQRLLREASERAREDAEAAVQKRTQELEFAQVEIVTRLAAAAEYRDDQTGQHTFRVGHVSARLAERLGLPTAEVDMIRLAARLHDVGKIGIPDAILLKPGRFTPEEFEVMKQHTLIGGRILSGGRSKLLQVAEEIALTHHERWDGLGYPHRLNGQNIPIGGRLVSVADVYDALTSERPYKEAWTPEAALLEIESQAGRQFDPQVVQAFGEMIRSGELERLNVEADQHLIAPGVLLDEGGGVLLPTRKAGGEQGSSARRLPEGVEIRLTELIREAWDKRRSHPVLAQALTEAASVLVEEYGDDLGRAYVQRNQSLTFLDANDLEAAAQLLRDAIAVARTHADLNLERDGLNLLAGVLSAADLQEEAQRLCEAASVLSATLGDGVGEANARTNLGVIQARMNQAEQAIETFRAASGLYAGAGAQAGLANCLYNLADTALEVGDIRLAIDCALQSMQAAQLSAQPNTGVLALGVLARAKSKSGFTVEAARLYEQLLASPHLDPDRLPEAWGWAKMYAAEDQAARGDEDGAQEGFENVLDLASRRQLQELELRARSRLVDLLLKQGDAAAAQQHLEHERSAREQHLSSQQINQRRGLRIKAVVADVLPLKDQDRSKNEAS
jgi:response regulator RpfG family c-di-GMP phosphodiesterase